LAAIVLPLEKAELRTASSAAEALTALRKDKHINTAFMKHLIPLNTFILLRIRLKGRAETIN
jgi:hypothetical protein